jgi:hypothetical protein
MVLSHMLNLHLSAAFDRWRDHSKQILRGENIVARVLRHWTHRSSTAAFEALLQWSRKMRRAHETKGRLSRKRTRRALAANFILFRLAAAISMMENLHIKVPHLIAMGITGGRARESLNRQRGKRSMSEPRFSVEERQELIARIENAWIKHAHDYWQAAEYECTVAREWYTQMARVYDHMCKQVCRGKKKAMPPFVLSVRASKYATRK